MHRFPAIRSPNPASRRGRRAALGLLALLLAASRPALAQGSGNWAADAELEGIVDLLDPDYLARPIKVARLPLRHAITQVHGKGQRVIYTFEDPNCGYCRELSRQLEAIGNLTVHTFVVTFLGEDSKTKADAVWCAGDRAAAWGAVMKKQAVPSAPAGCRAPTGDVMKLVGMLGINLTPTVFYSDGTRMNGVKPRAEIEARLRAASSAGNR